MVNIWSRSWLWTILVGVAVSLAGPLVRPAAAQNTYTVSTAAELGAAIATVNTGVGGDLIVLTDQTFSLTAPLTIIRDVTIQGDPVGHSAIEGDGLTNLLVLRANNVSLRNFTIRNGLSAVYWAGFGVLSVNGMTIAGTRDGVDANEGEGQIFITNSTISNNTGSGVQVMCPANLHMTNDTVSANGIGVKVLLTCGNVIEITNTLIVGNTSSDCGRYTSGFTPAGATSIDSDGTCVSRGFPGMATLSAADIDLGSLGDHGGPTPTRALAPTSAAINAGSSTGCPATDQRGFPRSDGWCDIGAYESGSAAAGKVYFVTTPQELADAIYDAQNSVGRDRIFLAPVVFPINSSTISTVRLAANDYTGPNDIKLIGAGAGATILEGGGLADRNDVVTVVGNSLITIEKMTIENGGAVGIYDNGNLVLRDVIVRDHGGSGIESVGNGLAISGSTISGNGAALNGGWGEGGIYVESTFSMVNSTVTGNQTNGIFVDYTDRGASLTNVTIAGNFGAGLGVFAPITITNTIVADDATGRNCDLSSPSQIISGGHNLIGDGSCNLGVIDISGVSPQLGVLQNNGGPTPTMELMVGSPAIDAGGSGACPATDQRGIARPQGAACDIGAFELELIPVNSAPTCVDYTGSTYAGGPPSGAVVCSDPDPGDTFTVSLLSNTPNGVLALYSDGTFTYAPNSGFVGTDSFTFQATDSQGVVSNIATATITVTQANRPPVCPDYVGSLTGGGPLNASVGCTDPDAGDTFTVTLLADASSGNLALNTDGTFTYLAANGFSGTVRFKYQATDSHGAVSNDGTATIQVVSQAPTCPNFSGAVPSGGAFDLGNALCSDPAGEQLTYSVVTAPAHGTAFLGALGRLVYSANAGYVGSDSFTYRATNSRGLVSNIATATIQVLDNAPTCSTGFFQSVGTGGSIAVWPPLRQLCSDPDPSDVLTYSVVTGPAHGTVDIPGIGSSYVPNSAYIGPDSFTFKATDSHGVDSNIGTVTIEVVNTRTGASVSVRPDPSVELTFSTVYVAGATTAVSSATGPALPAGFQVPGGSLQWEISTTTTYVPPIEVCIVIPPGVANPRLLHYEGGAWVDVTTRLNGAFVCGSVTSLSPFVVAVKVPVQTFDVAQQLQQLEAMIESFNLRKPVAKRFIHWLDEVEEEWRELRHNPRHRTKAFCEELEEFRRAVGKASGRTLTAAEAGQLLSLAQLIASEVRCGS